MLGGRGEGVMCVAREAVGGPHRTLVLDPAILERPHQHGSRSAVDILVGDS